MFSLGQAALYTVQFYFGKLKRQLARIWLGKPGKKIEVTNNKTKTYTQTENEKQKEQRTAKMKNRKNTINEKQQNDFACFCLFFRETKVTAGKDSLRRKGWGKRR